MLYILLVLYGSLFQTIDCYDGEIENLITSLSKQNKTKQNLTNLNLKLDNLPSTIDSLPKFNVKPEKLTFIIHTRSNKNQKLKLDSKEKIFFEDGLPLKILIHDFNGHAEESWIKNVTSTYLKHKNLNVVVIDWSNISRNFDYPKAVSYILSIASHSTKMILRILEDSNTSPSNVHILGHSIGAHIAGIIGHELKIFYKKFVDRITGLDPARRLFVNASKTLRLDSSDAKFVDVIHTDSGKLGIDIPIGNVDFYPQGGIAPQPACTNKQIDIFPGCSHILAPRYYVESITSKYFKAKNCQDFESYIKNNCKGHETVMGENVDRKASGKYYLSVHRYPPFARKGII